MATRPDQIDSEIDDALKQILEFFQVDRCALLEFQKDKAFVRITHAANGEGIEPISRDLNLAEHFPWCYEQLTQGRYLIIGRPEDYPEEALKDRQSQDAMGIKERADYPLDLWWPARASNRDQPYAPVSILAERVYPPVAPAGRCLRERPRTREGQR